MEKVQISQYVEFYYRIINHVNRAMNLSLSFNGSIPLHTASIHLIDVIGRNPGANMTQLSEILGITKGAVSQMVSSLERKGFVEKQPLKNSRALCPVLTEEGKKVWNGHQEFHREAYQKIEKALNEFTPEELQKFESLLHLIDETMETYQHKIK